MVFWLVASGLVCFVIIFHYFQHIAGTAFFSGMLFCFFFRQIYSYYYNFKISMIPFFSSEVFQYLMGEKGINHFRRKVLAGIRQLKDYRIFIIQNQKVFTYPDSESVQHYPQIGNLERIFLDSLDKTLFITPRYPMNFTNHNNDLDCYAYSYNIPVFNSRLIILAYFNRNTSPPHDKIRVANDIAAMLIFASGMSGNHNTAMALLDEVVWQSPYALGICNPKGELITGNTALYHLFKGRIPNFMELTDPEVFLLLLDGKKIGKTFHYNGQNIHLDAYPLNNKNYLVTQCLFVFYDAQVEFKRDLLGETNTLRRFTSAHPSVGTAMFTADGMLLYSNDAFMTHLGVMKVREAKQKNIFSLFRIEKKQFTTIINQVLEGHEHVESLYGMEKDLEFSVKFKGVVFGDKTILEVILDQSVLPDHVSMLDSETQELHEELKTARSVQEHILALPPMYRPGISVETSYVPYRQLSGDFFALVPFENDQLGFLMADVSGHGVSASLITAALKILSQFAPDDQSNLPRIIDYFNTYLADILPEGSFVTLFYGIINFRDNSLRYINCGHPFPVIENMETNQITSLDNMGFPLGGLLNISYDELVATVQLPPKSRILLYTDGLFQHFSGLIGEKFNLLGSLMQANKNVSNRKLLDIIYYQLVERNSSVPEDDVSMMLLSLDQTRTWKHKITIASTLIAVDNVISEISPYIQKEAELTESLFWKFRTCLYETLLNAVVHGNKYNTQKFVHLDYRIYDNLLAIRVQDEGTGFHYKTLKDPFDSENILKDFGRGITMVKHLADAVKFNKKGDQITLFFYLKGKQQ